MKYFDWGKHKDSEELIKKFRDDENLSWPQVAKRLSDIYNFPFTYEQIRNYYRRRRKFRTTLVDGGDYYSKPTDKITDEEIRKIWLNKEEVCDRSIKRERENRFHEIWFKEEAPIKLCFIGDQHLGGARSDLKKMRKDQSLISKTKNCYQIWCGDWIDNHIKHLAAIINSKTSPSEQIYMLEYLLSIAGDKIISVVGGNHEFWTKSYCGLDYHDKFFTNRNIKFQNHRLHLTVYLGQIEYRISVYHKYRYNSSFNLTHTVKRLWEQGEFDFHIGVVAHHHESAIEFFLKHGIQRWAIRPGSYLISDEYSLQQGYNDAEPNCPGVILYPNEFKIIGFRELKDGNTTH